MGLIIDTSVLVDIERRRRARPAGATGSIIAEVIGSLGAPDEAAALPAITASELLHGVHRADDQHRAVRSAYVEAVLAAFPVVPFDLLVARVHARVWADMTMRGLEIGAHDRLVAATALSLGWSVATANVRHFTMVPDLDVVPVG